MFRGSLIFVCAAAAGVLMMCNPVSSPEVPAEMLATPIVRVSDNIYDEEDIILNFVQTPIQQEFYDAYRNCTGICTDHLADRTIEEMQIQAAALGQDPVALTKCIYATSWVKRDHQPYITLPCLAEKAQFGTDEVWIIIFAWGYDLQELGHYATFVMDSASYERLYYTKCR